MVIAGINIEVGDTVVYKYKFEKGCNCISRKGEIERVCTLKIEDEASLDIVANLVKSPNFISLEKKC